MNMTQPKDDLLPPKVQNGPAYRAQLKSRNILLYRNKKKRDWTGLDSVRHNESIFPNSGKKEMEKVVEGQNTRRCPFHF